MKASRGIALIGIAALVMGLSTPGVASAADETDAHAQGQIVFQAPIKGRWQIFIENADGSHVRRLVKSGVDDTTPSISPDGKKVIFTRIFSEVSEGIFVVDVNGRNLNQLLIDGCTGNCLGDGVEGDPWSADGRSIAFIRVLADDSGNIANISVWTANVNGTHPRQVTQNDAWILAQDARPSWSPDGKRIAFERIDLTMEPAEPSAIFTVDVDGSDLEQVTSWVLNANDPAWSPDGGLIAFQSPQEPTQGVEQSIYTIHPDGSGLKQLTSGMSATPDGWQGSNHPSWSPDGRQLVFCHFPSTSGGADLFEMNRDGSRLHLVRHTALIENDSDWGPPPRH